MTNEAEARFLAALDLVLDAATELWAQDTSNHELKKALRILTSAVMNMPNQGDTNELDKVESDSHTLD